MQISLLKKNFFINNYENRTDTKFHSYNCECSKEVDKATCFLNPIFLVKPNLSFGSRNVVLEEIKADLSSNDEDKMIKAINGIAGWTDSDILEMGLTKEKCVEELLEPIITLFEEKKISNEDLIEKTIIVISGIGNPKHAVIMRNLIKKSGIPDNVKGFALNALESLGDNSDLELAKDLLTSKDRYAKYFAIRFILLKGNKDYIDNIVSATFDDDEFMARSDDEIGMVLGQAALAVIKFGGPQHIRCMDLLCKKSALPRDAKLAIRFIDKHGNREHSNLLRPFFDHSDGTVREEAMRVHKRLQT